jgi:hypothetical protein
MARQKIRVSVSEIEALRRRLREAASTGSGLPDEILQKFERLVTVANDPSLQDEAVRLATELYQFGEQQRRPKRRRVSTGPGQVNVHLQPPLLAALDAFVKEHDEHPSRPEAIRLILADSLTAYGLLPAPESSELNGR